MTEPASVRLAMQHGFLLILLALVSLAFAWLIGPFVGAILWGVIASILFAPFHRRVAALMPKHAGLAAASTLIVIVAVAVIPAMLLGAALLSQASATFGRIQSGEIDIGRGFIEAERHLPQTIRGWLADLGLNEFAGVRDRIGRGLASSFETLVGRAFDVGQSAFAFFLALGVMLYLTFFLLRDGQKLAALVENSLPLALAQRRLLVARFVAVVRATIKGSLIVAILQGLIGGLVFWSLGIGGALLWGVAMAIFSLFPAIGTGLIWVPVTVYLLVAGDFWRGGALFLSGFFIISSVDNIVRPILVGRDACMPDYVVLIATLGGFELMGFNGFVIGPVIAALFMAVWEIFGTENCEADDASQMNEGPPSGGVI
jgi:predicted PurR-regulated permease PerM